MKANKVFTYGILCGMTAIFLLNRTYKGKFVRDVLKLHTVQLIDDVRYGLNMSVED